MGKAIRRAFESCQRITLLTDVPAHRRRGRGDGFGAKLVELPRQRFVKLATQRGVDDRLKFCSRPCLHAL